MIGCIPTNFNKATSLITLSSRLWSNIALPPYLTTTFFELKSRIYGSASINVSALTVMLSKYLCCSSLLIVFSILAFMYFLFCLIRLKSQKVWISQTGYFSYYGNIGTIFSPVFSGRPNIKFIFWIAWPAAPLTTLSIAPIIMILPVLSSILKLTST